VLFFGYNRRAEAQPKCGEQVKFAFVTPFLGLRGMMRCSIKSDEWDPKLDSHKG
jgi:hypothetical protein